MSALRRIGIGLAPAFCLLLAGPAFAEPGPITLISKTSVEQAARATAPALSQSGSYVAFEGVMGGLQGVFREDLQTGEVEPVSTAPYPGRPPEISGMAPSVSADGRYISFTTEARLDPADDSGESTSDVYVADMSTTPPTYELASALDGSSEGLSYEGSGGSIASGRVALSADGRQVAFVTTAPSDLTGEPAATPAGQVVVRNLATRETTLVSVARDPVTGQMEPGVPVPGGAVNSNPAELLGGAALSADGTTVAWLGIDIAAQVPLLAEEARSIEFSEGGVEPYDEPLWRRVADGAYAPTRRITGGVGDSQAPGCPVDGSLAIPACRGAFPEMLEKTEVQSHQNASGWLGAPFVHGVPALSADGDEVALLGDPTNSGSVNLFVVDMAEGLARSAAVRQLTREVLLQPRNPFKDINTTGFLAQAGHLFDVAVSADGSRIALATARQQFPLSPPTLIGSPPSAEGLVELYVLDLGSETIQRLTHGDGGADEPSLPRAETSVNPEIGEGVTSPSLSATGESLAFASTAVNLAPGDGNEASDVFTVVDPRSPFLSGSSTLAQRLQSQPPPVRWRLALSASSLPNGKVRLVAVVPGAGTLRARATASISVGKKARNLASARKRAGSSGRLVEILALPKRLRHLAHVPGGLTATAQVSFSSPFGKRLKSRSQIRFHVHRAKKKGKRSR